MKVRENRLDGVVMTQIPLISSREEWFLILRQGQEDQKEERVQRPKAKKTQNGLCLNRRGAT